MTHRGAIRAWGRALRSWTNLGLFVAGLLPFVGWPSSTNLWEAAKADPRWLGLMLCILVISYHTAYKAIGSDRARCAQDALASDHRLRTAVALMEVRDLHHEGKELSRRAQIIGTASPSEEELRRWDGRVRQALHQRWASGVESNYVEYSWIRDGVPVYGTQLGYAVHYLELLKDSDGYAVT